MMKEFISKIAVLGMISLVSCAAPLVATSPYDRQVARVASLIAMEAPASHDMDLVELSRYIVTVSRDYNLDPLLVLSIIKVESGFKPDAKSFAGAIGLMQVMPIVIRAVGHEVSVAHRDELYNPYKNVRLGIHYFTTLLEKYGNNIRNALMAYNVGPTALDSRLSRGGLPTGYYQKVMRCYDSFRKKAVDFIEIT